MPINRRGPLKAPLAGQSGKEESFASKMKLLYTCALLLSSLLRAAEEEKAADGLAKYAPTVVESFIVDYFPLATAGNFTIGAGEEEWDEMASTGSGHLVGNTLVADSGDVEVLVSNRVYPLTDYGEWQLQASLSYVSTLNSALNTITSPLGFAQDPFYGQGYFAGIDLTAGWSFGFSLTNTRIYAVYARFPIGQNALNNFFSFIYYIPIAQRSPDLLNNLSIAINKQEKRVSWRADGFELLRVTRPGQAIADKFRVGDYGGLVADIGLPDALQITVGVMQLDANGSPHSACQQGIFQACAENADCAYKTLCQYAPIQTTPAYNITMAMTVNYISVIEQVPVLTCYEQVKYPMDSCCCPSSSSSSCSSSWSSSSRCPSSSSSSSCGGCPSSSSCSSSSSSGCGCRSSSSSSCGCSSSSSSSCGVNPPSSSTDCGCSSTSSDCGCTSSSAGGFINVCRRESSSSEQCVESSHDCRQRRENLRARGFIFPS